LQEHKYAQEHTPWHLLALVIFGNVIRGKNTREQLEKGRVDFEYREKEDNGYKDAEEVPQVRLAGGNADEKTAEWVRDK
jgi:hypothetical protein